MTPPLERFIDLPHLDRGAGLAWSPDGAEVLAAHDASGQLNLHRYGLNGGSAAVTTYAEEAVRHHVWTRHGIVFELDERADERLQLWRAGGGPPAPLARCPAVRHELGPLAPGGDRVLVAANRRRPEDMGVHVLDVASGELWPVVEAGGMFEPGPWHPDGRRAIVARVAGNTEREHLLVDVETLACRDAGIDAPGDDLRPVAFAPDGSAVLAITSRDADHRWLARLPTDGGPPEPVWRGEWSVEHAAVSAHGRLLAWTVNEDGRSRLHALDLATGRRLDPPAAPAGVVHHLAAAPGRLAVAASTAVRGAELYAVDLRAGAVRRLTELCAGGVPPEALVEPELVRFRTFDGRLIPAWLYPPRGRSGRAPVVVAIHGGPEAQEVPEYSGFFQYLVSRGIGVLAPNIRGSTGYGLAYQRLIYRDWGGGELRDVDAAAGYLASLPWVDASRLAVYGASFGGFVALSALSRLPGRWACGVDAFGPSSLVTLTRSVPPSWRPLMRALVGDPDDDAELLAARSPITHVEHIRAPLLVLQGAADPRVVRAESDQIVAALRGLGRHVEYVVFDDEGHGLTRRPSQLRAARAIARFLVRHLLGEAA